MLVAAKKLGQHAASGSNLLRQAAPLITPAAPCPAPPILLQPAEFGGSKMHRDIKPGNVCIQETPGGDLLPVVIDFGGYCNQNCSNYHRIVSYK